MLWQSEDPTPPAARPVRAAPPKARRLRLVHLAGQLPPYPQAHRENNP